MRVLIAIVLLVPVCFAQQGAAATPAQCVSIRTRILPLKGLPEPLLTISDGSTAISADGRIIVVSVADSLGGMNPDPMPAWIHDVEKGETRELKVQRDGKPYKLIGNAGLSPDGRFVAVACAPLDEQTGKALIEGDSSTGRVHAVVAVVDLQGGDAIFLDPKAQGFQAPLTLGAPSLSTGALQVLLPTYSKGRDVHGWPVLWSRADGSLRSLPLDELYRSMRQPGLSADGRWIVTDADASGPPVQSNALRVNVESGASEVISLGVEGARLSAIGCESIDASGRLVAFAAQPRSEPPLKDGPSDVYVREVATGSTECVTRSPTGGPADGHSYSCVLSADGHFLAFVSRATNLVPDCDDAEPDVFVRDLVARRTVRIRSGQSEDRLVGEPALSGDGRHVVFLRWDGKREAEVVIADIDWQQEPAPPR